MCVLPAALASPGKQYAWANELPSSACGPAARIRQVSAEILYAPYCNRIVVHTVKLAWEQDGWSERRLLLTHGPVILLIIEMEK